MYRGKYDQFAPSKKKMAKPKDVSLELTPQTELPMVDPPKVKLSNDENKSFDEDDDQATSTIPDLSIEPEEERETSLIGVWDHTIDTLFKLSSLHPDGRSLKQWVHYQTMDTM